MCVFLLMATVAAGKATLEYQVKASYLYNFTQFVEWPPEAFEHEESPLTVCVLGEDRMGEALDALEGRIVRNRKLTVKRCRTIDEVRTCHVLFISQSEKDRCDDILAALKGRPILVVGELPQMAQKGAMLNFVMKEGKVKFEANQEAAKAAGLKISSKVLKLALRVHGAPP